MTSSPGGYDLFFTDSALVEAAFLQESERETLNLLLRLLLNDPTESNPSVRNLSNGEGNSVYAFTVRRLTAVYQFVNPLVIRIIHISPLLNDID